MQLITSRINECVAASVAMLFDLTLEEVKSYHLFSEAYLTYPFTYPWHKVPKVPSMEEVCEWAYTNFQVGLVPFPYDPGCQLHACGETVPVYPNSQEALDRQMKLGSGMLEGRATDTSRGHMCAWDGGKILDPKGYVYLPEARAYNRFQIHQFWLRVN
jgi:hypothetical protein